MKLIIHVLLTRQNMVIFLRKLIFLDYKYISRRDFEKPFHDISLLCNDWNNALWLMTGPVIYWCLTVTNSNVQIQISWKFNDNSVDFPIPGVPRKIMDFVIWQMYLKGITVNNSLRSSQLLGDFLFLSQQRRTHL